MTRCGASLADRDVFATADDRERTAPFDSDSFTDIGNSTTVGKDTFVEGRSTVTLFTYSLVHRVDHELLAAVSSTFIHGPVTFVVDPFDEHGEPLTLFVDSSPDKDAHVMWDSCMDIAGPGTYILVFVKPNEGPGILVGVFFLVTGCFFT